MASKMGLVRSYYGWLVRTEKALRSEVDARKDILPAQRPTSLNPVAILAQDSARILKGTRFEKRANYWSDLFGRILNEGWKGDVLSVDTDRLKIQEELKTALDGLAFQA